MSVLDTDRLRQYNNLLTREVAALKQENLLLKRTVKQAIDLNLIQNIPLEIDLAIPDEEPESWTERSARFARLRSMLLKKTVELCKLHGRAVHQDEVLRAFRASYPTLSAGVTNFGETLGRRLRELRSEGYLSSPQQGMYFLGFRLKEAQR